MKYAVFFFTATTKNTSSSVQGEARERLRAELEQRHSAAPGHPHHGPPKALQLATQLIQVLQQPPAAGTSGSSQSGQLFSPGSPFLHSA